MARLKPRPFKAMTFPQPVKQHGFLYYLGHPFDWLTAGSETGPIKHYGLFQQPLPGGLELSLRRFVNL